MVNLKVNRDIRAAEALQIIKQSAAKGSFDGCQLWKEYKRKLMSIYTLQWLFSVQWLTRTALVGWQALPSGVHWRSWRRGHRPTVSAGSAAPVSSYQSEASWRSCKPPSLIVYSPPCFWLCFLYYPWWWHKSLWYRFTTYILDCKKTAEV